MYEFGAQMKGLGGNRNLEVFRIRMVIEHIGVDLVNPGERIA